MTFCFSTINKKISACFGRKKTSISPDEITIDNCYIPYVISDKNHNINDKNVTFDKSITSGILPVSRI